MRAKILLILCWSIGLGSIPAQAQTATHSKSAWADIFDADEAWLVGGTTAGTVVLHRADALLMARAQDSTLFERRLLSPIATRLNFVGRPGSFALGAGAFSLGKVLGNEGLADLGLHGIVALGVTEVSVRAVKGLVGRARPDVSGNPTDVRFGSGFGNKDRASFPSGHTASAFATAAVVQSELARRGSPYQIPVAIMMYGTASAVGLARIYDDRHWATDVLAGAALGYLIGENVVEFAHHGDETSPTSRPPSASRVASRTPRIPIFFARLPLPVL